MKNDNESSLSSSLPRQDSPGPPQLPRQDSFFGGSTPSPGSPEPSKHLTLALSDIRAHSETTIYNSLETYRDTLLTLPELKDFSLTWMNVQERLESEVTLLRGTHIRVGDDQVEGNKFTITRFKSSKEIPERNVQIISGMILRKILVDMAGEEHQNSKVFIDLSKEILTFIETNLGDSEAVVDIRITNPELTSAVVLSSAFEGTDSDGSQNEDETKKVKIKVESSESKTESISDQEISAGTSLQDKEANISDGESKKDLENEKDDLSDGQKSKSPACTKDRQDDEASEESSSESDSICSRSSSRLEKEMEKVHINDDMDTTSTLRHSTETHIETKQDIKPKVIPKELKEMTPTPSIRDKNQIRVLTVPYSLSRASSSKASSLGSESSARSGRSSRGFLPTLTVSQTEEAKNSPYTKLSILDVTRSAAPTNKRAYRAYRRQFDKVRQRHALGVLNDLEMRRKELAKQIYLENKVVKIISPSSTPSPLNRSSTSSLSPEEDIAELENDPGLAKIVGAIKNITNANISEIKSYKKPPNEVAASSEGKHHPELKRGPSLTETIAEIKSYDTPPKEIQDVIKCVFMILGEDIDRIQNWQECVVLLGKMGRSHVRRRVLRMRKSRVTEEVRQNAAEILAAWTTYDIAAKSRVCVLFFLWCKEICGLNKNPEANPLLPVIASRFQQRRLAQTPSRLITATPIMLRNAAEAFKALTTHVKE